MRSATDRGRVYLRCGCRDTNGDQVGASCPSLHADTDHGTWYFAVDIPNPERRTTIRRGGYSTEQYAREALLLFLESASTGYNADPNQTLADYLTDWLDTKRRKIKLNTYAGYHRYVTHDLIPALGAIRLEQLGHYHIAGYANKQLDAGRGRVTVHAILSTLSSALGDAVRQRRLTHNPARPIAVPRPPSPERQIWNEEEAVKFLDYCQGADPLYADLAEVLIGTGMRKGEALGLRWEDVRLNKRILYVRHSLTALNNNQLILGTPKTRTSRNWVALSDRVIEALHRRALEQGLTERHTPAPARNALPTSGFVFTDPDGQPLHPRHVTIRFHQLCDRAGVPRCSVHDLRHLAVTMAVDHGAPLVVVSKTVRHSTLSTTASIYHHLTARAEREAVEAIERALAFRTSRDTPRPPAISTHGFTNTRRHSRQRLRTIILANTPSALPASGKPLGTQY